jgi:hypothetical protein
LLTPFSANAESSCSDYKYKSGQSKVEPTEKGLKIVVTNQASVLMDDADLVEMAYAEAEAAARTSIQKFIKTEIASASKFSNGQVQNITMKSEDGKKFDVQKTKTALIEMSEKAEGLLRGVVPLGSCYTPGKFVRVTVGVKPETILAAGKMDATMSGPFKGINQSSDQAGNPTDGSSSDQMGPYNTMKGYSGLNEDF